MGGTKTPAKIEKPDDKEQLLPHKPPKATPSGGFGPPPKPAKPCKSGAIAGFSKLRGKVQTPKNREFTPFSEMGYILMPQFSNKGLTRF